VMEHIHLILMLMRLTCSSAAFLVSRYVALGLCVYYISLISCVFLYSFIFSSLLCLVQDFHNKYMQGFKRTDFNLRGTKIEFLQTFK